VHVTSQTNGRIVITAVLALLFSYSAYSEERLSTIRVSGEGQIAIAADIAMINVGVVREATTASAALTANSEAMTKVLAAMQARGIEDKDLQTANFNISPRYYYSPHKNGQERKPPSITGYTVSNNLSMRIRDLASVGDILDQVVTLGVNTGGKIQFANDNPTQALTAAREAAIKQAIAKANTLVNTAGVKLGKILSISENSHGTSPMPMMKASFASEAMSDSVPVAAGENAYSVTVNIEWEIDQ
jgi:uncharacterized protein YggE